MLMFAKVLSDKLSAKQVLNKLKGNDVKIINCPATVSKLHFHKNATFNFDGKAIENFLQVRRPAFLAMGPTFVD